MSRLTIYPDHNPDEILVNTIEGNEIAEHMEDIGVRFERWKTQEPLSKGANDDDVMAAYADDITRLKNENGYQSVDIIRLDSTHPDKKALRQKFLSEHVHSEDEVRFFVEGSGVFYLRTNGKVYMTLCERGDLISVPEGTKHWFDMGDNPHLTCIRLFTSKEGWVADFTGDKIADNFPKYETTSGRAA